MTANQAISNIPNGWEGHDVSKTKTINPPRPWDNRGNGFAPCVTTSGGMKIHPNGTRTLTVREIACLQGVPLQHKVGDKGAVKQIGNMVPPIVAHAFLDHIRRFLEKDDGVLHDER